MSPRPYVESHDASIQSRGEARSGGVNAAVSVLEESDKWSFLSSNEYLGPAVRCLGWKGGRSFSFQPYIERRRVGSAWARAVKDKPRANGSVADTSVLRGVEGKASIYEKGVKND